MPPRSTGILPVFAPSANHTSLISNSSAAMKKCPKLSHVGTSTPNFTSCLRPLAPSWLPSPPTTGHYQTLQLRKQPALPYHPPLPCPSSKTPSPSFAPKSKSPSCPSSPPATPTSPPPPPVCPRSKKPAP